MTITDMHDYTSRMGKSLDDKLFFLDHLNDIPKSQLGYIVDFGCADGLLLGELKQLGFESLIGYDNNWNMISIAREKQDKDIVFTGNLDFVLKAISKGSKKNVLILSSVIHEVIHYGTDEDFAEFIRNTLQNVSFDVIYIRDMMPSIDINKHSDMSDVVNIRMRTETGNYQLIQFEKNFGGIESNKNLVHYLLKYRYKENWDRECLENYFPIYLEEFLAINPIWRKVKMLIHEPLPFIKQRLMENLGYNLVDNTHVKMILETHRREDND